LDDVVDELNLIDIVQKLFFFNIFEIVQCQFMELLRRHIETITPINDDEDEVKYDFLVISGIYKVFNLDEKGKKYIVKFAQES